MKKMILFSDNGTISDLSRSVNNYYQGSNELTIVALEDKLYIGSRLPFNHIYIKLGTQKNANACDLSVEYWNGTEFVDTVNVDDETSVSGKTFAQSGFITWTPDRDEGYGIEDSEDITALSSVVVYDQYWTRFSFSADMTAIDLDWMGQIFSNDNDLSAEFSDLVSTDFKSAFGVSNYEKQHVKAAEIIEKDLIKSDYIRSSEQVLDRDDLILASVQKVAEILFNELGPDYDVRKKRAASEYKERLKNSHVIVDKNKNAREDISERKVKTRRLIR